MSDPSSLLKPFIQIVLHGKARRLSSSSHFLFPDQAPPTHFTPPFPRPTAATFTPSLSTHLPRRRAPAPFRCATGGPSDAGAGDNARPSGSSGEGNSKGGFWTKWKMDSAEMRSRIAKLGLAAVLAYGLFDGATYTTFFVLAFLGYEKSTGKNPAANLQALLGIVILMWTGNNVTRPFRVAGAAVLAPAIDKGLKKIQKYLNLPNQVYAFALVVGMVAGLCFSIVGLLILSRWGN